ncbi:MAG: hypothetical protein P8Y53_25990, partial [Pseudolabrys sp.]
MIAVGAVARRYHFVDAPFIDTANRLVYYLLRPSLLFYKIGTSEFRQAFSAPLVIGGYAATLITFFAATVVSRRLAITPGGRGSFVQGAVRANLAYVGLPIVFSAVGDIGLRKAGVLLGFMVPLINSLAILALIMPHAGESVFGRDWIVCRRIGGPRLPVTRGVAVAQALRGAL